jgi:hypothetical protein
MSIFSVSDEFLKQNSKVRKMFEEINQALANAGINEDIRNIKVTPEIGQLIKGIILKYIQ